MIIIKHIQTTAGELIIGSCNGEICLCDWANNRHRNAIDNRVKRALKSEYSEGADATILHATQELKEYFVGTRKVFDLPLRFTGTEFQQRVWTALLDIPYGTTTSYADIARRAGCPSSVRPVANAIGANPISIFIPCHRVVGSNNTLTGYGGGLTAKQILLDIEATSLIIK